MIPHDIQPRFHNQMKDGKFVGSTKYKAFDSVQHAAEQCGRQEVTEEWYTRFGIEHDMTLFRWVDGQSEFGMDPWRIMDGIYEYKPGTRIFVQVKDLQKAGLI